jgi:natural product biosynthesis luciferase-like monooxygenase protein
MTRLSSLFVGDDTLLIQCAEQWLDRGHTISVVVTGSDTVKSWADTKQLRVEAPGADLAARLGGLRVDWLFSIAFLSLIPDEVREKATQGAINFHDGPLPRYAGLNAPVWALLNGETEHGITWHLITSNVDEGDILVSAKFPIDKGATALSLNTQCFAVAIETFGPLIEAIETNTLTPQKQDFSQRQVFMRADRPAADAHIDYTWSAHKVASFVHALDHGEYWNPLALPKITAPDGSVLMVGGATVAPPDMAAPNAEPGQVLASDAQGLTIACKGGAVTLTNLRDADGNELAPTDVAQPGQGLPALSGREAEELDAAIAAIARAEPRWREALKNLRPVELPDVRPARAEGPNWRSAATALPEGLKTVRWAKILGLFLRNASADRDASDIALSVRDAPNAPGYLSDWVPFRIEVSDTASRKDLDAQMTKAFSEALAAPACARDLAMRDPEIPPLRTPAVGLSLGADSPVPGTVLTLALSDSGKARLWGDVSRISERFIDIVGERLNGFAEGLAKLDLVEPVASVPAMPAAEKALVCEAWNKTKTHFDASLTMAAAFEQQVAKTPDAVALIHEDTELTYAELNARANRAAHVLQQMGVQPGMLVGLCLRRTPHLIVGALAILKAGGAYVPIDPAYPADRIALYLEDSAAPVVVTESALADGLPPHKAQVLDLDRDPRIAETADTNPDSAATGEDLAYVIYTSGSTGRPKGVMVEHRNVSNFFVGMDARIPSNPPGTWLAVTSLSFDISVLELFWTLSRGFRVVLMGDDERALVSDAPVGRAGAIDFSLFYWGNDDGIGPSKYELLLEGAKFADQNGFNAVWTPERHFHAFGGPYPNPSVTGAAVAAVTKNLEVRAGSCVAPLHHPLRIAEEWSVIDNLTNGRTGLAIASGWHPEDFVLRPENAPPNNKPAMYESMEQLRRLWRGEKVPFAMADGREVEVLTQPRPVSKELKLWVTVAGNPETWRDAGRYGCNVLTHLLGQSMDDVRERIGIYHDALREAGHDPADFKVTLMLHTYVAEDRETAREIAREPMKGYLQSAAMLVKQYAWAFPAFKRPQGVTNPSEIDLRSLSDEESDAILEFAFLRYFEDSGLFGSVDDCVARIEQVKEMGVTEVACLIDYGIARDIVLEGLKPLAEVLRLSNSGLAAEEGDYSIAAQIVRHGVTHLQCTPSMARMILMNDESRAALSGVRQLMIGGEALPGTLAAELTRAAPRSVVTNMYGPTETTIWSTTGPADPTAVVSSIGTPIANTRVYVLDAAQQLLPIGAEGELWIGGAGVTRGYWQRPDLTEDRFRPDPFSEGRMYNTGDKARWTPDGKLEYAGRSDHQVKLRGYRIELGEVEAVAVGQGTVTQALAMVREDTPGDPRLVLYVTGTDTLEEAQLREDLADTLPLHMVPSNIVVLESFPLTPNRKVDRNALPKPGAEVIESAGTRSDPAVAGAAPAAVPAAAAQAASPTGGGEAQDVIAQIWSKVLGVGHIGPDDNFFTLGGHSLLAVQAHREIRNALGANSISITDIFRYPTLSALAAHIDPGAAAPSAGHAAPGAGGAGRADAPAGAGPATQGQAAARSEAMSKRRAMRARRGS